MCFSYSYNLDMEEKKEGLNWSDHKTLPIGEMGTLCVTGPNQVRITLDESGLFLLLCGEQGFVHALEMHKALM